MEKLTEILKKLNDQNISYNVLLNSHETTVIEIDYGYSEYSLVVTLNKHKEIHIKLSDRPEFEIQVSVERAINIINRFIEYND